MPVRCQEEAIRVLGDHFDALATIILESVRLYYEFYGPRAHTHEAWTRCSIIRDEIVEGLIAYCESTTGFHLVRDGNATYFGAFSKFTIRIKKLSDDLHANTGKTQLSFDYDHQVPIQFELFVDTELTHLYLGYVPIDNDPLNPPMYLVCNDEAGEVVWSIPLAPPAPPPAIVLGPPPIAPTAPDAPRRVRAKLTAGSKKVGNE